MYRELKNHIQRLLKEGSRLDGRGLTDYREPIIVKRNVTETAEGSSQVQIGDTKVICGIKLSLEKPFPDTPEVGGIMVNIELLPLSSSDFEPGPPSINAIELSRVIDRGIRESKAIDVKSLCVTPGEEAWTVIVDICIINAAGNLWDACSLAALAALKDTRFPTFEDGKVDYKKKSDRKLELSKEAISITVLRIGDKYLIDPSIEEERVYDARLTVATIEDGSLAALQKGGDSPLSLEDIDEMIKLATEKGKFLRDKLKG